MSLYHRPSSTRKSRTGLGTKIGNRRRTIDRDEKIIASNKEERGEAIVFPSSQYYLSICRGEGSDAQ